jgi:hypothetical protein
MKLGEHVDLEMAIQLILGELKLIDSYPSIEDELKKIIVSEYCLAEYFCQDVQRRFSSPLASAS